MLLVSGRRMGERRQGEGGVQPSVPNGAGWLDDAAWSRVWDRFKPAAGGRTRLHARFGPCVVRQLPGGSHPRTASHRVSGRIVNHQRQEWTELRRDWKPRRYRYACGRAVRRVLRGGAFLEKANRNNGLRGTLTWIACFS